MIRSALLPALLAVLLLLTACGQTGPLRPVETPPTSEENTNE